jgi:hypothetical protein
MTPSTSSKSNDGEAQPVLVVANPSSRPSSFLQLGTILREQHHLEHLAGRRVHHGRDRILDGHTHALPHLLLEEAVAHAHRGLEGELLALEHLGVGEPLVVLLQREHTEGDVAGLVAHHVAEQLLEQRLGRSSCA